MTTSSSHAKTHAMDLQYTNCTKLCDEVYQLHVPKNGAISLDIVLFHGFQSTDDGDAYLRCWRREEDPTCSLNSLLAEAFPQARILAVAYDASIIESEKKGRMDMYAIGENLMRSLISPAMVGQTCPVVLVGHCVGGLVLKEVCLRADDFGGREKHTDVHQCAYLHFLRNLRGAFFYATAHSGSPISGEGKSKRRGPLFAYFELLSSEAGRVNARFETLRGTHGWKVAGVSEANETDTSTLALTPLKRWLGRTHSTTLVTHEASGRQGMKDGYFCVIPGEDHFSICRPKDRRSTSFLRLEEFLGAICKEEEEQVANQRLFLQLPVVMIDVPERIAAIVHMLQLESSKTSPLAVQLVGMGGIGKSTLAKQILMNIQSHFDYVCFVEVGKETLSSKVLERLVADDLYTGRGRRMLVRNVDELWMLVKNSKVLMVLDDVESEEQIKLFLEQSFFGDGSRMIVTSRVQKAMAGCVTYVVPFLSNEDAEKLFRAHVDDVVLQKIPNELMRKVVCKCDGLPLTLEVIGGHLRGETDISIWKGAVEKLCAAESLGGSVNDRLWQKLRLSFDGLGAAERGRFLDLTSFDIYGPWQEQYDLDVFKAAWGTAVEIELQNLVDRSLIRLRRGYGAGGGQRDGEVHIHAQLRDMGRNICRPPGEKLKLCRGVWKQDDTEDLMMECKRETAATDWALQTLCTAMCPVGVSEAAVRSIPWSIFPRLECLRLLRMSNLKTTKSNRNVRFPLTLTLLHMINCHRGDPKNWWMRTSGKWPIRDEDVEGLYHLAVLLLDDCKFVQLPDNIDRLRSLRVIRIDASKMASLPDTFGLLPRLETLQLRSANLQKLPSSFLQLRSLSSLKMTGCSGLKAWPTPDPYSIARKDSCLGSLRVLHLEGLASLAELPDSFGEMRNLERLEIRYCHRLKTLPEGFGGLKRLNDLWIEKCNGLRSLCESLGSLENLAFVHLSILPELASLPSSTGSLTSLQRLQLRCIPRLSYVPESLGQLRALNVLSFSQCRGLKCLPDSLEGLGALEYLQITSCPRFASVDESVTQITALKDLDLYPTTTATSEQFPRSTGILNHFQALTTLRIHKCEIIDDSLVRTTNKIEVTGHS